MSRYDNEIEVDVIVVGYGAAGGTAALTAARNGADTLIIEKAERPGGNSYSSSAMMIYPQDFAQKEQLVEYLHDVTLNTTPKELVQTFVDGLERNPEWFKTIDGELEVYDYKRADPTISYWIPDKTFGQLPSAKNLSLELRRIKPSSIATEATGGARTWGLINRAIEKQANVQVWTDTPVQEIVKNNLGQVIGVLVDKKGKTVFCKARKGVIMSCGGFEHDTELKRQYLRPPTLGASGAPSNTGDGIRMIETVGADLWHMDAEASAVGTKPEGYESGFVLTVRRPGFIYVDSHGDRFCNEARLEAHNAGAAFGQFDMQTYSYKSMPSFLIMDKENATGKPLAMDIFSYNVVVEGYKWSENNQVEIDKGWIKKADTLAELAEITGIEEVTLLGTLTKYNNDCRNGVDSQLGRPVETLKPIDAPYYAVNIEPLMYNTQGGPRRDVHSRVLAPGGTPIPNLYAAGEFGSIWGFRYQTSTNFSETIVFGRLAGEHAAKMRGIESFESIQLDGPVTA